MESVRTPPRSLTPLWVVSIFVSLTETVLGVGVIHTTGGVQIALTVFVMAFAPLVALGFFLILWFKPYVFYPPAEFAQVDVATYVAAMRSSSLVSGDKLYSQIEKTVKNVLSSKETQLTLLMEDKDRVMPANLNRLLQTVASEAVEEIRKTSFVTVDSRPLDEDKGTIFQIHYDQDLPVDQFLDSVYFAINKDCALGDSILIPFTYTKSWILRDRDSGKVFDEIGAQWSWRQGKQHDSRPLGSIGITAGLFLEAIPVPSADT